MLGQNNCEVGRLVLWVSSGPHSVLDFLFRMDVKNVLCKGGDLSFSMFVFAPVYMHTNKNVGAFIPECVCVWRQRLTLVVFLHCFLLLFFIIVIIITIIFEPGSLYLALVTL